MVFLPVNIPEPYSKTSCLILLKLWQSEISGEFPPCIEAYILHVVATVSIRVQKKVSPLLSHCGIPVAVQWRHRTACNHLGTQYLYLYKLGTYLVVSSQIIPIITIICITGLRDGDLCASIQIWWRSMVGYETLKWRM